MDTRQYGPILDQFGADPDRVRAELGPAADVLDAAAGMDPDNMSRTMAGWATVAAGAACAATAVGAPICGVALAILAPVFTALAGLVTDLLTPEKLPDSMLSLPDSGEIALSLSEMIALANASEAWRAEEERIIGLMSAIYAQGLYEGTGGKVGEVEARRVAIDALQANGYHFDPIKSEPSWADNVNMSGQPGYCADSRNVAMCAPGNDLWHRITAPCDRGYDCNRPNYRAAVAELRERIAAMPAASVAALSQIGQAIASEVVQRAPAIAAAQDKAAKVAAEAGAHAGSAYLRELEAQHPDEVSALRAAAAAGEEITADDIQAAIRPEIGAGGEYAAPTTEIGTMGVVVLGVIAVGALMLGARKAR